MTTSTMWAGDERDYTKASFAKKSWVMRQMKHLALAAATAAALVLAGCGGSSSTTATTPKEPMAPAVPTMDDAAQLAALKAAHKAAMDALNKLKDDLTDATRAEVDDAEAKLAALEAAITAATGVTDATKSLYSATGIKSDLAKAKEDAAPALAAMVEVEKAIAAARTKAKAALDAAEVAKDLAADGREATEATGDMEAMPAKTGSKEAQGVTTGFVPVQTGKDPVGLAAKAKDAADKAMVEYEKAKAAHARAMAATTKAEAEKAQQDAEAARDKAQEYAMTANTEAMKAVQAAMGALRYDAETMTYSTGEGSGKRSVMVGEGTKVGSVRIGHPGKARANPSGEIAKHQPTIYARNVALGDTYSRSMETTTSLRLMNKYYRDDGVDARIYIVHNLASGGNGATGGWTTSELAGMVVVNGRTPSSNGYVTLGNNVRSNLVHITSPNYHRHIRLDGTNSGGSSSSSYLNRAPYNVSNTIVLADSRNHGDLYYFVDENGGRVYLSITADRNENPIVDGKLYARQASVYPHERKAWPAAVQDSELSTGKIGIPIVYDHMHINYGMWNDIKPGVKNSPADLGIGFVNVLEGKAKTPVADRPTGTATYKGGWVATMRAEGEVDSAVFSNHEGPSKVTANFDDNSVTVDLMQVTVEIDNKASGPLTPTTIAKFTGAIDGTGFMGTKITNVGDIGDLTAADDGDGYAGEFSGAFYGPEAEETGGVFDFDGEKKGALRGAFGGGKGEYGAEAEGDS